MAAFSSAGPALAGSGDLLKPDITAPGLDIVAAVFPVGHRRYAGYLGMIEFGDGTGPRAWTAVVVGPAPPTLPALRS